MCIIIGDPIEHSLSPAMHNAAYEFLGIDHQFVYTAARVMSGNISDVVKAVRAMGVRGLTCTIPHKVEVMRFLDDIDPIATKIGAVNTVVNNNGLLKGYNTDWIGLVTSLEKHCILQGKKVALIGAGGAGRAMGYGVVAKGAHLTVFNRTREKSEGLAREIGGNVASQSYDSLETYIPEMDIILNATSLGMGEHKSESPIPSELISKHHIVFDAVYNPYETRLLQEAAQRGATVIHGTEMLLYQGTTQFELYTNQKAPVEVMKKTLFDALGIGQKENI